MSTAVYTHSECLSHVTPPGHPEQVARLVAVAEALDTPGFAALERRSAPLGEIADILRCHPQGYVDRVRAAIPEEGAGVVSLDADTHVMSGSWNAALRGVGGVCAAVDAVLAGEVGNAFVACRPPGHHAETETAMGFCLFGNIAIGAKRALDHHGLSRVAVVDFDVHHGNGTQDLLWDEARAFFISSHQMPLYPGSGARHETGAHGNVFNLPFPPDTAGPAFRRQYEAEVFPALENFRPELILVSAGFDAHRADPLAQMALVEEDFAWVTGRLCEIAAEFCDGRVVSTLEGGYDLPALGASTAAHVKTLMEHAQ
ncbi:histone deacetylase family protein [Dinoroseobacter shibae DFL 12 = DSM 16493]|jgi:acetoin utilization deacetylase AcuC-like enzyme|uniref:Histone deacetylase family protein n=1 Tax=Dinoroseobacter shibae (strain DSM 16493 / NCIMB 14021 / DFL 12) TaxID=398580 RepID=A8LMV5_DINSH|nr:histone deacetylase family protein [Dinoroseobacter shibae]ABV95030.1 histone deacetylase family protein [Dinoroseobacter shibae DFL 12 = DSM 16493]URF46446.1 histone deacetylase family protein [Dinoroseobacter shibae]URF50752.1 histone deacetylase family protein [Dinoroseobacter shibae]